MFRSVGKFTTDEVDKTAFVRVDLPAFFVMAAAVPKLRLSN